MTENRDQLLLAIQQLFGLTPTEISLLLVLVQHPVLLKERIADTMNMSTVDVHICNIRKRLTRYGIEIDTRWGHGYQFSPENRQKIMDLILHRVAHGS